MIGIRVTSFMCLCIQNEKKNANNNVDNGTATRKFTSFCIHTVRHVRYIRFYAPLLLIDSLPLLPILINK